VVTRRRRAAELTITTIAALVVLPAVAGADVAPSQLLSFDPFVAGAGQHETAVEPDSFSVGDTVVTAFQVARIESGGASGIGWATSTDGGTTWTTGLLPKLTQAQSPPGSASRVSDPAVAYDRVHGVWLVSVLALRDAGSSLPFSSLLVSRSGDGHSWSEPVVTARDESRFAHDKNWIVCDNGPASPYAGNCYVVWTDSNTGALAVSISRDGGVSWSAPALAPSASGSGWQPLARPDGTLVVVYETERSIDSVRSLDGGRTFAASSVVSALRTSPVPGMRAPALPSAEIDGAGRIVVAWQDCRFRTGCPAPASPNDLLITSSQDGVRWSTTRRVPTAPALDGLHHFVPGLGVDQASSGSTMRAAVVFSVLGPRGCTSETCRVQSYFVSTTNAGVGWSAPQPLGSAQPLDAFPQSTTGRFLGDYVSTSFVAGGVAVPVFASATGPFNGRFHQGVFATRIPPLAVQEPLRVGQPTVTPRRPRAASRVTIAAKVTAVSLGAPSVGCQARGSRVRLRLVRRGIFGGRASCTWLVRSAPRLARVTGTITVASPEAEAARRFEFRTR
jgi:hypothetical protein